MLDMRPNPIDGDPWLGWHDANFAGLATSASHAADSRFDHLPVGIFLAAGVADLEFDRLPAAERVEAVAALQRLVSHYQAQLYAGVAFLYGYLEDDFDGDIELAHGATAAEIRAELRLTRRSADITVDLALALSTRLPALHEALRAGLVDIARVKTIVSGTEHLSDDTAREVVNQVLADSPQLTTGQLAARVRKLCIEVDPDDASDRFTSAVEHRRVELRSDPAGTGHLLALDLDPVRVSTAMDRVNCLARSLKVGDEHRSIDQLRADVFLDLSCDGSHAASRETGSTHITVDLETLIGLEDRPGDLAGFGPIVADLARQAAAASRRWECSIRDGDTGEVIAAGTTRRRPTVALAHAVKAANPTCVFPGCRMPATGCDVDHIDDFANGGATTFDNLAPACRHDHNIKHRYGWTYRRRSDGTYEWTSRLGRKHSTGPP